MSRSSGKPDSSEPAQRDMDKSPFAAIIGRLRENFRGVEAAAFFDSEGETIDYDGELDPFATRLLAAHHGVIYSSFQSRLDWLHLGRIDSFEIRTSERETLTLPVAEDFYLMVVMQAGASSVQLRAAIEEVALALHEEAGF